MSVALSLVNSPQAVPGSIDHPSIIRDFMAGPGHGFKEIWYFNPNLPGSGGTMSRPPMDRASWIGACYEAAKAGAELVPYLGGGATGDTPTGDALTADLECYRGSPACAFDQVADDEMSGPSEEEANEAMRLGFNYHPEGNTKSQEWVRDLVSDFPQWVSPTAEYWLWDHPIPGANLTWNDKRWGIQELIDLGATPTILIARDMNNKGAGFCRNTGTADHPKWVPTLTAAQWATKKVEIAEHLHAFYGGKVKCVVRPAGAGAPIDAAGLDRLRKLNGG